MADTDTPDSDAPVKKPVRRRSTTPAKAAPAKPRAPRVKVEPVAETPAPAKPAKPAKAPPKPRSSKRTAPPATARKNAARKKVETATEKVGGKWGVAAIAGGLAAAGVATAALLALRSSSAKPGDPAPAKPKEKAHQPDGTDASKSFSAGIADENTIPG